MFLNDFDNETIRSFLDDNKFITYPVVMILFIVFSLILGRFDTKFGVRKEEMRNASNENPVLMEILEKASGGGEQPEFFSTHPSTRNRKEEIRKAIDKYQ